MTTKADRWLLPDGVDEILPPRADQLETLRREILELYRTWGYDLIKTPLIEFLDSLFITPSSELQLSTFKIIDQLSGKSMGVRADISSQAARIDAHVLQKDAPVRLCYADSVLRTLPKGHLGSRSPQLIGAELYGHRGIQSDIEVISLMLLTLRCAGLADSLLSLGHSSICRILLRKADLPADISGKLFTAMQNKASTDVASLLDAARLDEKLNHCLSRLPTLQGGREVLDEAQSLFEGIDPELDAALRELRDIDAGLARRFGEQAIHFDLCEQRGFDYHTGVVFSAYVSGYGQAVANGGRYDALGAAFGRSRAATGFDSDLKTLLALSKRRFAPVQKIFAPDLDDAGLAKVVDDLRASGRAVVQGFSGNGGHAESPGELGCELQLVRQDGNWKVVPLD